MADDFVITTDDVMTTTGDVTSMIDDAVLFIDVNVVILIDKILSMVDLLHIFSQMYNLEWSSYARQYLDELSWDVVSKTEETDVLLFVSWRVEKIIQIAWKRFVISQISE